MDDKGKKGGMYDGQSLETARKEKEPFPRNEPYNRKGPHRAGRGTAPLPLGGGPLPRRQSKKIHPGRRQKKGKGGG